MNIHKETQITINGVYGYLKIKASGDEVIVEVGYDDSRTYEKASMKLKRSDIQEVIDALFEVMNEGK